jgi:uncharacterized Fe-S cluster-containing radical SAM superfamily protein
MKKKPEAFCIIPWVHFEFDASNVTPCCHTASNFTPVKFQGDLIESLNHESIQEIRKDLLNNTMPLACQNCYKSENAGFLSEREKNNHFFKDLIPAVIKRSETLIKEEDIVYGDIRLSNLCNQSCRVCSPYFSTLWNKDALKLGTIEEPIIKKNKATDLPELENCKRFRFSGGEPLIDPEHKIFLEKLGQRYDASELSLDYNSNLDIDLKSLKEFITTWGLFKHVTLSASIDHTEKDKYEYIRSFGSWKRVQENFEYLQKQAPQIYLRIQFTLSVFNILDFPKIIHTFINEYHLSPLDIEIYPLHSPDYYSMTILPEEIKHNVEVELESLLKKIMKGSELADEYIVFYKKAKNLIKLMKENDDTKLIHVFQHNTKALDEIRNHHIEKVFPNLTKALNF